MHGVEPSPWVTRFAPLIATGGTVLDVAAGPGRHSRYLAARGCTVEAVDRDAEALATLAGCDGIHTCCADIEGGPWPYHGRSFDAIVVTRYLWRPLLPTLCAALAPGGVLIYETFMVGHEAYGKPSNPAYLLRPGELLDVVRNRLGIVAFEQGEEPGDKGPQVMQRLCAQRGGTLRLA